MGLVETVFFGLAVVTAGSAVAAMVGWYYALDRYGRYMSDRSRALMRYGVPPAVLLSVAPVVDVLLWRFAGVPFPTIGFVAPALGLVGGVAVATYVVLDIRRTMLLDSTTSPPVD